MRRLSPFALAHWLMHRFDDVSGGDVSGGDVSGGDVHGGRVDLRAALYGVDVLDLERLAADALDRRHEYADPAAARTVFVAQAADIDGGAALVDEHLLVAANHDAAVLVSAMWVGVPPSSPRPGAFAGRRRARVLTVVCDAGGLSVLCTAGGEVGHLHGAAPVPGSAALLAGWHAARTC